jgi:predicted nucleotidyltransferase component of viral defense system
VPFREIYHRQVALLIRLLPLIAPEDCFALKGGTAINLFIRDLPRLSVDIDLTYLPIASRDESLKAIDAAMKRIGERISTRIDGASLTAGQSENAVVKWHVRANGVQTKIEVTPVLRGCVQPPEIRDVTPSVEAAFGFAEARVLSLADLYAGKIVAALDRQHPRDLFDIRDLLAHDGIDQSLRRAFVIYLLSHNRPMADVLAARRKDIEVEFRRGFQGMTDQPVALSDLYAARETLIATILDDMPEDHRRFLTSFERGEPEWPLLGIPEAAELPAVRWRQRNLDRLKPSERRRLVAALETVLRAR